MCPLDSGRRVPGYTLRMTVCLPARKQPDTRKMQGDSLGRQKRASPRGKVINKNDGISWKEIKHPLGGRIGGWEKKGGGAGKNEQVK